MPTRRMFSARSYQKAMRDARKAGCKNFCCLWHRRAGKDRNAATFCFEEMLIRPGNYFHLFPALNQGRRDFWANTIETIDDNGKKHAVNMVDACFPPEFVARRDNAAMEIVLKPQFGGGRYQIMGADDDDAVARLRGPNPFGVIASEFAHGKYMAKAMDTLAPVFAENGGWRVLVYTPNGTNHGKTWYETAVDNPYSKAFNPYGWFVQKLTVEDTRKDAIGEDGGPVVSPEFIAAQIKEGKRPEYIRQEYWCDFTGFEHSTIYGDLVRAAHTDGRITDVGYIANLPVGVCFDLGSSKYDAMVLWFYQRAAGMTRFIDYLEGTQKSVAWAAQQMRETKPYMYGRIVLPWDGQAARSYFEEVGFKNVHVNEHTNNLQGEIDAVRRDFSTFVFDRSKCQRGIECLREYKRKYDEDRQVFEAPIHDQYSHGADALRTGVIGGFEPLFFPGLDYDRVKVYDSFDPRINV